MKTAMQGHQTLASSPSLRPVLRRWCGVVGLLLGPVLSGCDKQTSDLVVDRDGDQWIDEVDCDDSNPNVHPFADEFCDGIDNDCDGELDEGHAVDPLSWFADLDGDGYGDPGEVRAACTAPTGYVDNTDDCDDSDANVSPLGIEVCNDKDDDCDGTIDEPGSGFPSTFYRDGDSDGYGNIDDSVEGCDPPTGYVADATDCDDSAANVNPGADEVCDDNNVDEDCDGFVDDDDESVTDLNEWYLDADSDLHGVPEGVVLACEQPAGYAGLNDDCDDSDRTVNPSAREICGDGVDNNCDGLTDSEDPSARAVRWYTDADGDGYGDPAAYWGEACDDPGGLSVDPTDCDDTDASINPGVVEVWYDGIDADCAGDDDYDADADGYQSDAFGGEDCEDADSDVYPDHVDVCGDGIDSDCDGIDPCAVDLVLTGAAAGDLAGQRVSSTGDLDGDGLADFAVGADRADPAGAASGSVFLWMGAATGTQSLSGAAAVLHGEALGDHAGGDVTGVGDVNGDGINDMLVGAYDTDFTDTNAGSAYLMLGPFSGEHSLSEAAARLDGEAADDKAGYSVAAAGDFDGDSFADLLVGAYGNDSSAPDAGAAYLFRGPITGEFPLWTAEVVLLGEQGGDQAGWDVASAGDADGDGILDIAVGAPYEHGDGTYRGAAYIVSGDTRGTYSLSEAMAVAYGTNGGDLAGHALAAGDLNDDGYDDLVVGAPESDLGGSASGAAYVLEGPVAGELLLRDATMVIVGENNDDRFGSDVSVSPDIDLDGIDDLVIGAARDDSTNSNAGAVYIILDYEVGTVDAVLAEAKIPGDAADEQLGTSVVGVGDIDGDGSGDVLAGVPFAMPGGKAVVVYGGGWAE